MHRFRGTLIQTALLSSSLLLVGPGLAQITPPDAGPLTLEDARTRYMQAPGAVVAAGQKPRYGELRLKTARTKLNVARQRAQVGSGAAALVEQAQEAGTVSRLQVAALNVTVAQAQLALAAEQQVYLTDLALPLAAPPAGQP